MNQMPPELAEEAPLDPAAERVRRKMVRLLAVSMSIMFIGVFAVLAAVIFQIGESGQARFQAGEIAIPSGFVIVESDVSDAALMLRGTDADGAPLVLIYDRRSGALLRSFSVVDAASSPTN